MGIGKFLLGGIGAVGAVVLAPVVLPAAAAIATTAGAAAVATTGAAAAAVGGAAAATAAAAGSAVAAAGTAIAGTAVGTAAVGTMATVGGAVGAAAGSVGLGAVATVASTSAGAAAVGAISTSAAVGLTTGISGASKMKEATETIDRANQIVKLAEKRLETSEKNVNDSLLSLGQIKLSVWQKIDLFAKTGSKIRNIPNRDELEIDGELNFDKLNMQEFQNLSLSLTDILAGGAASLTSAQIIGLATSAGFTSLATASTGTAIAGLHGAAASNAALAALGGGAKVVGGLGMAGGSVVAGALTFAPALAIGGVFLSKKGSKNLEEARDALYEAKDYSNEVDKACAEMDKLQSLCISMENCLKNIEPTFVKCLNRLEKLVENKTDFNTFTIDEQKDFFNTVKIAKILKNLTLTQLMDSKTNKVEEKFVNNEIEKNREDFRKIKI